MRVLFEVEFFLTNNWWKEFEVRKLLLQLFVTVLYLFIDPGKYAVVGYHNSTKNFKKWKESNCKVLGFLLKSCIYLTSLSKRLFKDIL